MTQHRSIRPASRTANITYAVRDVIVLAQQVAAEGMDMIYLNIGDPNVHGFSPPAGLIDNVSEAMLSNRFGYSPSSGVPEAVSAIERDARAKGITDIQDVFVTTGASEAIDLAIAALIEPGDNILTPQPGYPLYQATITKYVGEVRPYRLDESNRWLPDLGDMRAKIDDRTRAIVLINPGNPTGSVIGADMLREIVAIASEHNLLLLVDEIYDKLLLDGRTHVAAGALAGDVPVVTFGGISKSHQVPGLRIGWGVISGPQDVVADYIEAINKFLRARLSANHPAQYAVPNALADDGLTHLPGVIEKLTRRRDLTVEMLNAIDGIECVVPEAAFYAFPKLDINRPDSEFAVELLRETGVVVVPGSGFGQDEGTAHFRVVYLAPEDRLEEAYRRIDQFMQKFRCV
jgi:alanine-synthesizing transaminase